MIFQPPSSGLKPTSEQLSQLTPLFVQFIAWQRLLKVNQELQEIQMEQEAQVQIHNFGNLCYKEQQQVRAQQEAEQVISSFLISRKKEATTPSFHSKETVG